MAQKHTIMKLPIREIKDARTANMFLYGIIFNQTQKSDRCFEAPYVLEERMGGIEPEILSVTQLEVLKYILEQKPVIHPFSSAMAKNLIISSQTLISAYSSDARNIWKGVNDENELIKKFEEFAGIGYKKALVAVFLLSHHLNLFGMSDKLVNKVAVSCTGVYNRYKPLIK
ncbi:MAG: hypothetical protein M0D57_05010 [Sphingobacteriales bacterium JAD_PAG50586_3]|nr:MAG: hypothetical protein M0D57_05010 [Sphingobacteriales bacterium JAD_PAG50586_3]